ncbi:MAG TPA: septal ring lytic transglycosylase RlpA family protein [Hyphomonas sp.]|nr:septal ring lytic transglycosylase RlpA family protein [Hyphomonas sp.]
MKTAASASKSILLLGAMALAVAAPAAADKRTPAPIVYATGTSPYPAGQPQYIEPSRAPNAQAKKEARIQFRYPGQAGETYAATSQKEAGQGSEPAPRQYASIETPASSYQSDVTVSAADSFDARAAAARIEAQRSAPAIESEALPSLEPAQVPAVAVQQPAPQPVPVVRDQTPAATYAVSGEPVPVFDETGIAIVYGDEYAGLPTANGEMYDPNAMTAAHPTLPLPSLIQVVNTATGKEVVLRVNDRGPFEDGASLQVSPRAAAELGMGGAGKASLRIRYLGAAPTVTAPAPEPQMVAENTYSEPVYTMAPQEYLEPVAYVPAQPQPQYTYTPAPAPAGDYFVQIGSFTDIANAQSLSNQVRAELPVSIVPARVNGADYFRVRVGPLASREVAERARQDLSYAGIAQGRVVSGE